MNSTDAAETVATVLTRLRSDGAVEVPHIVGGAEDRSGASLPREDPSHPETLVSVGLEGSELVVDRAVQAARAAQGRWARIAPHERAARLATATQLVTPRRRAEMAAIIAAETGKSISACLGEVDEVVTFFDLYSRQVADPGLFTEDFSQARPGMMSVSELRPFGVFGVIAPFNYPMALAAGPAIAALLAGNAVVIKPPHLAPRSTHAFVDLLLELDLPTGLVNVVHGGDETGRALVSASIDGVAFTGSVNAGRSIMAAMQNGRYPRPVIAEMGGKNPVIVTDTADVEVAARGIAFSAFDLTGQKCSACSRVLAMPGVYDELVERLAQEAAQLSVGDPTESAFAGPLISRSALDRYERAAAEAGSVGQVLRAVSDVPRTGYFVPPTVVADVPADHWLAREEHFMPFVTVTRVTGLDQALAEANSVDVGLTAGIYTGADADADRFLAEIEAGCVNVNDPQHATTGWWPGQQNFGGWKGSGSTGKLGFGKWYVGLFGREQCRTVPASLGSQAP